VHFNIAAFSIAAGVTVNVEPFNGTDYGSLEIRAQTVNIAGTLSADGAGWGGGGGGGGMRCSDVVACSVAQIAIVPTGGLGERGGGPGGNGGLSLAAPYTGGGVGGPGGGLWGGVAAVPNADVNYAPNGSAGGYAMLEGNGDATTSVELYLGSGGRGANGGGDLDSNPSSQGGGGGGAGNPGGGTITLRVAGAVSITGRVTARGWIGQTGTGASHVPAGIGIGGNAFDRFTSAGGDGGNQAQNGGTGGPGAGGGIMIITGNGEITLGPAGAKDVLDVGQGGVACGAAPAPGGSGTVKIFGPDGDYSSLAGFLCAGRFCSAPFGQGCVDR
jgi:hypothetical protein